MIVPPLDGFTHHNQLRVFVAERQGGALHCPARVCDPRQWGAPGHRPGGSRAGGALCPFASNTPTPGMLDKQFLVWYNISNLSILDK